MELAVQKRYYHAAYNDRAEASGGRDRVPSERNPHGRGRPLSIFALLQIPNPKIAIALFMSENAGWGGAMLHFSATLMIQKNILKHHRPPQASIIKIPK